MKKITHLLFASFLCLVVTTAHAATIQVAAPADLTTTYSGAADGTIIELTTSGGAYTWSAVASITTDKSLTIRATAGLALPPVITYTGATAGATKYFVNYTVAGSALTTLTFDGVVFDGASKAAALFLTKCSVSSNINVEVSNCIFQHFYAGAKLFYFAAATTSPTPKYGNLSVSNSVFKDFGTAVLNTSGLTTTPDNTSFSNCLFEGSAATTTAIKVNTTGYNKITVDHCTFNNFTAQELHFSNALTPNVLTNTIFANSTNTVTANQFGTSTSAITLGADCGVYYTAAGAKATLYPGSTSAIATNPAIDANGYATASAYISTATDGKNIGYYNSAADVTAPTVPSGLGNTTPTSTSFTLSWTASTDAVGVTGYDVYKNDVLYGSTASTSMDITNLSASTAYSMTVKAKDAANNISTASSALVVNTAAPDVTAPTVPSGLGNTTPTTTSFTLSWTASTDAVGVTDYDVYKDDVLYGSTASTSMDITNLSASTAYSMSVKAKDAANNISATSSALVVTTAAPAADGTAPTVPTGLGNTTPTTSSFTLSWTASTDAVGVTGYDVYKDDVLYGSTASTSLAITALSESTAYSMTVKAKDAAANVSAASTALVVTTADGTAPTVPAGLGNTTPTTTSFTLSWTASTDAVSVTGYDVYKDDVLYGSTASTSLAITGLTSASSYSMTVKAKDAAANVSAASTALVVTTAAATVWQVASGDISATYSNASFGSGDIIELTANGATGAYTWVGKTITKSFSIRAASSVTTRPIVTLPAGVAITTSNNASPYTLSFDGIDFLGAGGATPTSTGLTSAKAVPGGDLNVTMNNCIVRNLTSAAKVFAYANTGTGWITQAQWYGDLNVTNSEFTGTYAGVLAYAQYAGPNNATFRNCNFSGLTGSIINNGTASNNTTNSLTLDHCTFNGSTGIEINIKNGGTSTTIVKNSIFANSPGSASATDVVALSTAPGNAANTNNAVYYSGTQLISTRYPSGLLGAYITSNPSLTSNFATAAAYIGTATDNRNIGYYNFAVLTPFITASTTSIAGISYNLGAGPSSPVKSFTVSAFDLTNGLVITPTSNLEISTSANSNFSTNAITLTPSNHDVATTTIYVRLKAGLAINTYNQSITMTHTGATTRTISVAAQVISSDPNIQTSVTSLTGFNRFQAGGPSQPKSFVVTGANLTSDINITAPTNYEISLSPTTGYTYSVLTLSKYGNALNTTVYVRLSKNLQTGSSTQNLTLSSTGAVSVNVSCSGSITAIATTNFTTNATNNIDLRIASNYSAAAMPIYSTQDHVNKVFVRNPACWASDLDLTCISPSNFNYNNLHAGTLITPRHAILAAHFKLSTGDSLYFVTADNKTIRRKIIGYKINTIFSPTQFPDLEIVTLDSDVPSSIQPCKFLPSNYATYLSNNGRNLPTFSTDQEEKALVNEVESLNSSLVINSNPAVMMYSEHACSTTPRSSLHEAIISGDSGNPVFLIIRGELVLVTSRTWDNGAGSSYTHFANLATGGTTSPTDPTANTLSINDLIAQTDAVAGVSTGYQVKYFDFINAPATTAQYTVAAPVNSSTLTASSDVTVTSTGTLTVNTSTTLNNLTVAPGAKLNLSNPLIVNDLTLKSDINTSFSTNIGSNGITVNGEINFLKKMDDTKWYFMSFPCDVPVSKILQSDGSSLGVLGTDWFIKYYDGAQYATSGDATVNWLNFTGSTLLANKGYIFGLHDVGVKELSFPLTKAVAVAETLQTIPVTAYGAGTAAPIGRTGWNLIGQPYLSKFTGSNTNVNYITTSDGTSVYSQQVKENVTIDPMSAYFIQVDAGLASSGISFALAGRQAAPSMVTADLSERIKINVSTSTGTDNTNLIMDNVQSTNYEIGQDLEKWIGTGTGKPQIYSILGDVNYAYNALPMSNVSNLSVGLYTLTAGASTISADATLAPSLSKLILTDNKFSPAVVTDLLTSNYSFTADAGTDNTRFKITAQRVATSAKNESLKQLPTIIVVNSSLTINNLEENSIVRLYDMSGHLLLTKKANKNTIEIALRANGLYTIQVQNDSEIWTRKLFNR